MYQHEFDSALHQSLEPQRSLFSSLPETFTIDLDFPSNINIPEVEFHLSRGERERGSGGDRERGREGAIDWQKIPNKQPTTNNQQQTTNNETQDIEVQATEGINPAFDLIGLTQLRNDPDFAGIDGSGFTVAVIDTGLDATHFELEPNFRAFVDFVYGDGTTITNPEDTTWTGEHGTHVAGIVGAADENIGVATDVGLIGLQVFETSGYAQNPTIEDALEWVLDNREEYNIIAVNMSLGGGFFSSETEVFGDILEDDIQRLERAGITVVSAGGNSYADAQYPNFSAPAIFSTLAVGAVWQDDVNSFLQWGSGAIDYTTGADRLTSFSQRLDAPNTIFAPGALINSTVPNNGFEEMAGTSMASPMVAGAVALMQEAALEFGGRLLSPDEVAEIMRSTADTIFDGDDEDDNVTNTNISYPRLNIYKAISEIRRIFDDIAPPPPDTNAGDANGTIQGAIIGPTLDGSPVNPILGSIGIDGTSTNIGDRDVDIYRFSLSAPGNVTIELGSNLNNLADFDSFLRLFDQSGNELAFDDDGVGQGGFSRLETSLDAGTYYVGVSGFDNSSYDPNVADSGTSGATGNYALQFSLSNDDPNGILSGAREVNLGNDREPAFFQGTIGADYGQTVGVADVDLFKLVVPDNGILFIDIDTPYESDYVDSYLRLFDAEGNQVFFSDTGEAAVSDDNLSFDAAGNYTEFEDSLYPELVFQDPIDRTYYYGHRTDSFLGAVVDRGDVYYIGISDYFNQDYDPTNLDNRLDAGTGGAYDLTITFINPDVNGSITQAITDAPLPNIGQPGTIGADGDPETGALLEVGDRDVDFVKVNSPEAGILEIDIDSYNNNSTENPLDSVVFLFDANGNLLASDDDTDSFDPLLQFEIAANTDYFVAVTGYGNENFDPFALGSGSGGDTGEYIFNSQLLPLTRSTTLSDNTINDGAVRAIAVADVVSGNIGEDNGFVIGADDIDLYRFIPTTSGLVDIRTTTNEEFTANTFLRFFDASGNEIAFNDNEDATTRGSFLQVEVIAGTEYFIGVNGSSADARNYDPVTGEGAADGSQGDYSLSLTTGVAPNNAPIAVEDNASTDENNPITVNVLANDSDSDGTINPASVTIVDNPNNGSISINPDTGEVTYSPNRDFNGSDRFTYTIQDDDGATSDPATVNLTINPAKVQTDLLFGSLHNDPMTLPSSEHLQLAFSGAGEDEIYAESTNPNLSDRFYTASGDDLIIPGTNDRLLGGDGNDTLDASTGGSGNRLYSGAGNDKLIAGSSDFLIGGTGEDEFILADGSLPNELNIVGDFEDAIDRILINNLNLSVEDISISEGTIAINGQNITQLLGVDSALLTIDDSNPNSVSIV
jgi:hypothetical protein